METLYYLNNDRQNPFTLKDIEDGGIFIFEDDLIWHDKLEDWTTAKNVIELNHLLKKRPPQSKKNKLLKIIKLVSLKTLIIYFIFSLALGIFSGLIEKNQFESFYKEIKKSFDENEKEREIERQKLLESKNKIEQEVDDEISKYNLSISDLRIKIKENEIEWENELYSSYPDFRKIDEFKKKNDLLVLDIEAYENKIQEIENNSTNELEVLTPISYSVPMNEVYVRKEDGSYWTRWCVYVNDINQNENLSYQNCHSFLFRPYYAIFSVANISQDEQNNILILLMNFVISSYVSNLPLILILFIILFIIEKRKNFSLKH